ncbi:amidohydrolase [Streptomyces nodosus]|uniref:Amidohydrolase n=2 Tax=Streptomyces nodosus TaxID=40318 RepID=A0A0B5DIV8_9ACTN|nr:amidohydrolase [Streptomyces nodosus]AJE43638.1 amidohydrolase [Streptomyces nodosus]MBB4795134.1 putative amidohydrolase YtcJ [Streptomyces nodosus]
MDKDATMPAQLYRNARIFTSDRRTWAESLVVVGDRLTYVGDEATAARVAGPDALIHDLDGATVLPGFVDGHAHVVGTGEAAVQVDLWGANTVTEIQRRIRTWAEENPDAPRVLATGWKHGDIPGGTPDRSMLDAVVADRPVYAQAYDFHSIWLNSAALAEAGIDDATPSPPGGTIHRDERGAATGLVDETAMHHLVWPVLDRFADDSDRDEALAVVLAAYAESGIVGSTEMALVEADYEAMRRADAASALTTRIAAFWRVQPTGDEGSNLAQVERAVELATHRATPFLRVTGIKVMVDGTVDGCTAALGKPYVNGANSDPIWSLAELAPVVAAADAAGLQVAMHAIGDEAIRVAIGAVEHAVALNGPKERRHRIEHLEVVDPADIERLAALGITASMQPVHADPAIQENWRRVLGDERVDRGFPWPEMTDAGAVLALGTDSPTSPHAPLPNMFIAATRRSALDPSLPANIAHYALPLADAIVHATRDAAWASRSEQLHGRLAEGLYADFIVLDRDIFTRPLEELLDTRVLRTVVGGRVVHQAQPGANR